MTQGVGVAAAFDGSVSQSANQSAEVIATQSQTIGTGGDITISLSIDTYVGKNYTGTPQKIAVATIYPATDIGFAQMVGTGQSPGLTITVNPTKIGRAHV